MTAMQDWAAEVDRRSEMFLGLTEENLARIASDWPRTDATPPAVAGLLAESRRLWVGAAHTYANFVASSLSALHGAERALRLRLGVLAGTRKTFGQLVYTGGVEAVLDHDLDRIAWYRRFALHLRNRLSHPDEVLALTPGTAEPIVRTCHEQVAFLYGLEWHGPLAVRGEQQRRREPDTSLEHLVRKFGRIRARS